MKGRDGYGQTMEGQRNNLVGYKMTCIATTWKKREMGMGITKY